MNTLLTGICLATLLVGSARAEPENRMVLNIEPSATTPRNSEGAFVTLKSGRILFDYSQFYGGHHDESPAHIAEIFSDDRGVTWSAPKVVIENGTNQNVMSVSFLRLASGKILMFYLIKRNSWLNCEPYLRVTTDEGSTWTEPKPIVDIPGLWVLNNDRVIQLSTGRIIAPFAFHRVKGTADARSSSDSRAIDLWYYSDDDGATWHEASSWWALPVVSKTGLQEPGAVELVDGSLFSWARTDRGAQYGFRSTDHGETWSAPEVTEMKSPVAPASIKRLPHSADLLAIYNDHSGQFPFVADRRTPLISAISHDGGRTWVNRKQLEGGPTGWYCYTAIHFVDDAVLLGYCAGEYPDHRLDRLRIRRIALDWLTRKTGE